MYFILEALCRPCQAHIMSRPPVRLFVDQPLLAAASILLEPAQSHYLVSVMRHAAGDVVELFNGCDGAWLAQILDANRKRCVVSLQSQSAIQEVPDDLWLLCAPLKKERLNWTAEKSCELGVARFVPVQTQRSMAERLNPDRLRAHMIEAAEQCGRTHVPEIAPLVKLDALLSYWPINRALLFCDESGGANIAPTLRAHRADAWGLLIGPEGGFTPDERAALLVHPATVAVTLGSNILRADTAAVAAIAIWQALRHEIGR
jgi:16S rRNA (uracil1498-N3)-methyltransferase